MTRTRLRKTTTKLANGTRVTKTTLIQADPLEWECQAAAVRDLRQLPGYGDEAGPGVTWTFAADFNSARRSMNESVKAKATGIKAGEEDLRLYAVGGAVLLLELKGPKTAVSADQKKRHALHRHLGFRVEVIRCKTIEQGAADVVALVQGWLASVDGSEGGRAAVVGGLAGVGAAGGEVPLMAAAGHQEANDNQTTGGRKVG